MAAAKAAKNAQYCKKYMQKNPEEIRKMIERGRSFKGSIGNIANQRSTRNIPKKKGKENKEVCT